MGTTEVRIRTQFSFQTSQKKLARLLTLNVAGQPTTVNVVAIQVLSLEKCDRDLQCNVKIVVGTVDPGDITRGGAGSPTDPNQFNTDQLQNAQFRRLLKQLKIDFTQERVLHLLNVENVPGTSGSLRIFIAALACAKIPMLAAYAAEKGFVGPLVRCQCPGETTEDNFKVGVIGLIVQVPCSDLVRGYQVLSDLVIAAPFNESQLCINYNNIRQLVKKRVPDGCIECEQKVCEQEFKNNPPFLPQAQEIKSSNGQEIRIRIQFTFKTDDKTLAELLTWSSRPSRDNPHLVRFPGGSLSLTGNKGSDKLVKLIVGTNDPTNIQRGGADNPFSPNPLRSNQEQVEQFAKDLCLFGIPYKTQQIVQLLNLETFPGTPGVLRRQVAALVCAKINILALYPTEPPINLPLTVCPCEDKTTELKAGIVGLAFEVPCSQVEKAALTLASFDLDAEESLCINITNVKQLLPSDCSDMRKEK